MTCTDDIFGTHNAHRRQCEHHQLLRRSRHRCADAPDGTTPACRQRRRNQPASSTRLRNPSRPGRHALARLRGQLAGCRPRRCGDHLLRVCLHPGPQATHTGEHRDRRRRRLLPVLVGWAAVTGRVGLPALLFAAVVFFWTPPRYSGLLPCDSETTTRPLVSRCYRWWPAASW